jgi:hypothetical protein
MQAVKKNISWSVFKKNLQRRSKWLDAFTESAIGQAIEIVKQKPRNYYEPLLLETVLKEAAGALDRCLALRREAYELEIAAVKAAADYELFLQLLPIDAKLETVALATERLRGEESGYREAASTFTSDKGFRKHDETLSVSAQAALAAADKLQKLLDDRWKLREQFEAGYNLRHTTPGNAHNFKERMERIIPLLADDLQEGYEKLIAASIGIKTICNKDFPIPELQGEKVLDELVIWTREAIRFLELEKQQEVSYELIIPLTQKWRPSENPILSYEDLKKSIEKPGPQKIISFELSDVFFNQERVRLRGVGLSVGTTPVGLDFGSIERFGYWRLRATIHTPKQPKVTKRGGYYERPPVVLGNVAVHSHAVTVAMASGTECRNVDPRGKWTIVLNRLGVWSDNKEWSIEKDLIQDLKLHLSVVAKPSPDKDSVFVP